MLMDESVPHRRPQKPPGPVARFVLHRDGGGLDGRNFEGRLAAGNLRPTRIRGDESSAS